MYCLVAPHTDYTHTPEVYYHLSHTCMYGILQCKILIHNPEYPVSLRTVWCPNRKQDTANHQFDLGMIMLSIYIHGTECSQGKGNNHTNVWGDYSMIYVTTVTQRPSGISGDDSKTDKTNDCPSKIMARNYRENVQ